MRILSADFGTSSLKLAVLDDTSGVIAARRVPYDCDVDGEGRAQIAPGEVLRAFVEGTKALPDLVGEVDALSFCVFCPSLVPLDRDGEPLHPVVTHLDRRSVPQARRALEVVGKETFLGINGNIPFPGGISLTSILWLKEHHPDIYRRTRAFGHLNTYLHGVFTGCLVIDPTNASYTGLYETVKWGGWSKELCGALGLDIGKLPEIRPSLSVVGGLSGAAARASGLKAGIPVLMGANDTASGAFGAGVLDEGAILNVSGSNEIVTVSADRPLPHEGVYLRTHVVRGKWLLLAITAGGSALEWARRELFREVDPGSFYGTLLPRFIGERLAGSGTLRARGLGAADVARGVKFAPYLAGDRHSIDQKKASFEGITLDTTREDLLAALLSGIFQPFEIVLGVCRDRIELKRDIVLTGGLVNGAWVELKRRLFPDFRFSHVEECPTLGNGRIAAQALSP